MKAIIIGMGVAGLTAAIRSYELGDEVILVVKTDDVNLSASAWAQGGIVTRGEGDSPEQLRADMLKAASGMTHSEILELFIQEAPAFVDDFFVQKIKVPFELKKESRGVLTRKEFPLSSGEPSGDLAKQASFAGTMSPRSPRPPPLSEHRFTREAGHSCARILFSGDETGKTIITKLYTYLLEQTNVKILWNHLALDLINIPHHSVDPMSVYEETRCVGVYVFDQKTEEVKSLFADKLILATGGIGQIYKCTTNPASATGDGIAIAHRAGARVINMEFTQFHPTSLALKKANSFLISEALRGEGAVVINEAGKDFTRESDAAGSLMARDKLSRSILYEQLRTGEDHVYLSLENCDFDFEKRFPQIYEKCRSLGLDFDKKRIPVTPAFHFSCGGILTNADGETSALNLYAVGECACTGVHGANRLASTGLMEAAYFGYRAAEHRPRLLEQVEPKMVRDWQTTKHPIRVDSEMLAHDFSTLRSLMWNYVGVIRKKHTLARALKELFFLKDRVDEYYRMSEPQRSVVELRNAVQTAILVTEAAIKNTVSVGSHYIEAGDASALA